MSRGRVRPTANQVYAVVATVCEVRSCWRHTPSYGDVTEQLKRKCSAPDSLKPMVIATYSSPGPSTSLVNAFTKIGVRAEIRVGSPLEWERFDGTAQEKYEAAENAIAAVAARAQEAERRASTLDEPKKKRRRREVA